jgi:threonine/homoserine/homoserine lactone efflux protein
MDIQTLSIFIPTFLVVAVTPGINMTLAMVLGMTIGVRKTMWMMYGEIIGVAIIAILAIVGVARLMIAYPIVFECFKLLGATYLAYIGLQLWRSKGKISISENIDIPTTSSLGLFSQGFVTSIVNPKGWAFMVSLLPPFIISTKPLVPQILVLTFIIMCCEFICMLMYASGGKSLKHFLKHAKNVKIMNRASGSIMILIALWLALGK